MTLIKSNSGIYNYLIVLLIALFFVSCEKYPDPSVKSLVSYYFSKNGSDQRALAGNFLKDSIITKVMGDASTTNSDFEVHYEVIKGGGSVENDFLLVKQNEKASTKWKLGSTSNQQILKTSIYEKGGKFLSSFNYYGTSFRSNMCDTVSTYPEVSVLHMVADTINNVTFLCTYNQLFKQGANYFDWIPVQSNLWTSVFSIEMSKDNIIYLTTWSGDLFKSLDHGVSWVGCNKPFPAYSNYFYIQVTSDGTVWANTWNYPLRFSKDEGETWTAANLPVEQQPNHICRLSDGSILALTFDTKLWRSEDGGLTWTNLNTSGYPLYLYVTDSDEVIIETQEDGISIKKSIDRGDHFSRVYYSNRSFSGTIWNSIHKKGDTYYIMIQGKKIITTKDFLHFSDLWNNDLIFDLFMDHRGTLVSSELNRGKAYYYVPGSN